VDSPEIAYVRTSDRADIADATLKGSEEPVRAWAVRWE
jgi:hypothetical protein